MLVQQNPSARPPNYVDSLMIRSPWDFASLILHPEVVWLFVALAGVIFLYALPSAATRPEWRNPGLRLATFVSSVVGVFAVLSVLGYYPFGVRSRWDISTQVVLYLSVAVLAASLLRATEARSGRVMRTSTLAVVSALLIFGFTPPTKEQVLAAVSECFDPSQSWAINEGALPTYRLHAEVLRAPAVSGAPMPVVYREYTPVESPYEGDGGSFLIEPTDAVAYDQILLNFYSSDDLRVLQSSHEVCFSGRNTVFLKRD
jgi:hypothetical protein